MNKIIFYNNEMNKYEILKFKTFKKALQEYLIILDIPWWECDISNLKIFKNGKDITKKVNKILEV